MCKRLLAMLIAVVIAVTAVPQVAAEEVAPLPPRPAPPRNLPCDCCNYGNHVTFPCGVCNADDCVFCSPYQPGDVDGDGYLTLRDATEILLSIVNLTNVIEGNQRAFNAGNVTRPGQTIEKLTAPDAVIILRKLVNLPSNGFCPALSVNWDYKEAFIIEVCYSNGGIIKFYTPREIPADSTFYIDTPANRFARYDGEGYISSHISSNYNIAFASFSQYYDSECIAMGITREAIPADTWLGTQWLRAGIKPRDTNMIRCKRECCGGQYGFGRVTDTGARPTVVDAVEVLRYVAGLPSVITANANARLAANITAPGTGEPTVTDGLAILRFAVGLDSPVLDNMYW